MACYECWKCPPTGSIKLKFDFRAPPDFFKLWQGKDCVWTTFYQANWRPKWSKKGAVFANIDPTKNFPTTLSYQCCAPALAAEALSSTITEEHHLIYNLSEPEKGVVALASMSWASQHELSAFLMQIGVLSSSNATRHLLQDKTPTQVCSMQVWQANMAIYSWQLHQLCGLWSSWCLERRRLIAWEHDFCWSFCLFHTW